MMAGTSGGYGYFGEGFATDGNGLRDYGLICDDPNYWRETKPTLWIVQIVGVNYYTKVFMVIASHQSGEVLGNNA
jgi:hypothetical protein